MFYSKAYYLKAATTQGGRSTMLFFVTWFHGMMCKIVLNIIAHGAMELCTMQNHWLSRLYVEFKAFAIIKWVSPKRMAANLDYGRMMAKYPNSYPKLELDIPLKCLKS